MKFQDLGWVTINTYFLLNLNSLKSQRFSFDFTHKSTKSILVSTWTRLSKLLPTTLRRLTSCKLLPAFHLKRILKQKTQQKKERSVSLFQYKFAKQQLTEQRVGQLYIRGCLICYSFRIQESIMRLSFNCINIVDFQFMQCTRDEKQQRLFETTQW